MSKNSTDKVLAEVRNLIGTITEKIADEIEDTAKEAVWDYGRYTGPGASSGVYHDGYMLAVLRWYAGMVDNEYEDKWKNPPKCEQLRDYGDPEDQED